MEDFKSCRWVTYVGTPGHVCVRNINPAGQVTAIEVCFRPHSDPWEYRATDHRNFELPSAGLVPIETPAPVPFYPHHKSTKR